MDGLANRRRHGLTTSRDIDVRGAQGGGEGVAGIAVLPARGGDAVKIAVVRARIDGSSVATIAATMSVVVLFDMVAPTALVLAVCFSGSLPLAPGLPDHGAVTWLVVLAAGAGARSDCAWRSGRSGLGGSGIKRAGARACCARRRATPPPAALVQAVAWLCRIGVVFCLLAAFGLHANPVAAATVMVRCGVSTLVPLTPGGAGPRQVMLAYALSQTATAATVVSFSVGMQVGVTAVNALLGLAGAMLAFRTARPVTALRSAWRLARV